MTFGALVVGEALIDEVVEAGRTTRHPGGSPANVALGLGRLNVATRLHTAIGDDDDGRRIRQHLAGSGVAVTPESVTSAPTSRAVATLAADRSASYEFALGWAPNPLDDIGSPKVIHTGSLGVALEPGAAVTADIVRRGRSAGALISCDPNVRLALVDDANATRQRLTTMAFSSHLVKLSDEDADFLFPAKSLDHVLDLLVGSGPAVVGITRGAKGALLASAEHRVEVAPIPTVVADTVGAGDSFMAALIWALVSEGGGWDGQPVSEQRLADIGTSAALAAAITVSRPGADLPVVSDLITHQTPREEHGAKR